MIHGTDDTNVPYDSGYCYNGMLPGVMPYMYGSHPIAGRLDEIGITDYEFHPFEGEGHAFYFVPLLYTLIEEKFDACFSITRDFLYNHLVFPTSIPEIAETMVQVYPNPANTLMTIYFGEVLDDRIFSTVVTDMMGRSMFSESQASLPFTMDVSHWPSGVYVIRLEQGSHSFVRKFLKR
jgi:hypothetical protein